MECYAILCSIFSLSSDGKTPDGSLALTGWGFVIATLAYVTRDGRPVHRNCGLVTETKPNV